MKNFARAEIVVNLNDIKDNVKLLKKMVRQGTMLMAVVKADGYGLGMCEAAKAAVEAGADWLGVATVKEGLTLRRAGLVAPILVFCPVFEEEFESIILEDLTSTVFLLAACEKLSRVAVALGKTADIHIKLDTGLNRLGYRSDNMDTVIDEVLAIAGLPGIHIGGVYSHLATSDSDPSFVAEQRYKFINSMISDLEGAGIKFPLKHISNSGGVLNHPECNLDMVRCGILVYGMSPCSTPQGAAKIEALGFRQALTFKSRVAHVKTVKAGESVGYSRKYFAEKDITVATVLVGYADGLSRQLSNKGRVLINGHYCNIIGNVCMDQFMVDATGAGVEIGDEVIIIGRSGGERILAEDVAGLQGSINYEVATALSMRGAKRYVEK
ncbi:MAG: alanine racemase [Oscillospiraceae bacterium]|nr:alanine racemase [Oscillospiraceae bacterium]